MKFFKSVALVFFLLTLTASYASAKPVGDYETVGKVPAVNSLEKVAFDEYFNFTCPHCNNFNKASTKLKEKFSKVLKINYIPILFRNQSDFPLRLFYIAQAKGKGLEVKNLIFSTAFDQNVNIYDPSVINYLARAAGLSEEYRKEANADWVNQRIHMSMAKAEQVGVRATPTVVLADALLVSPKKGMNTFVANLENLIVQLQKKK